MIVGVVHTYSSDCHCHYSLLHALWRLGYATQELDCHDLNNIAADIVFDHTDTFHNNGKFRYKVREKLERKGIKVIGPPSSAVKLCDNKPATKQKFVELNVPTPKYAIMTSVRDCSLKYPRVLKLAYSHCSRGLQLARNKGEYEQKLAESLKKYHQPIIVEEYIEGREVGVTVIGGKKPIILPQVELVYKGPLLLADKECAMKKAVVPQIEEHAKRIWKEFGLRGYCRMDIKLKDGVPYFLEVNPIPSLVYKDVVHRAAEYAGINYDSLIHRLIKSS